MMMKAAKQRRTSACKVSFTQSNVDTDNGCNRAKTPRKVSAGSKTSGQSDSVLIGKGCTSLSPSTLQPLSEQFSIKGICLPETICNEPILKLEPSLKVRSFTKINIQLFPIDEATRKELEKDGYNPYLELTVSNRKKISSVLKHLKSKWGNSTVAFGDLILFPYNVQTENLVAYRRWTLEDTDTCADVFAVIGNPGIFRLRYGWFSSADARTICIPLKSSQYRDHSQLDSNMTLATKEVEKQPCKTVTQEYIPINTSNIPSSLHDKPIPLDRVAEPLDNSKTGYGLTLCSSLWADSLTNISIGGLFSEASLQAAVNRGNPVPAGIDLCSQQTPFSCDSFDAAIASYLRGPSQGSQYHPLAPHSSILDAEETCHAFSYQKFISSGKEVPFSSRRATLGSCSQDGNSKLFKFPNLVKVSSQTGTRDHILHDPKAVPPPNTQPEDNSVSSSLGMADMSCFISGDSLSLGGLLTSGDTLSLGGLLANSLDAWRNCSRDGKVAPT